jgi:thiol-disulfide isomerase/thioredoxin
MRRLFLALASIAFAFAPILAAAQPGNFVLREPTEAMPELQFTDAEGQSRTLADFHGKVILLNLWATWCYPCRKEMPALDQLQASLGGGPDFEVVPLSIDRGGVEAVKKFYAENGIEHLSIHIDQTGKAVFALAAPGLPTTFLVDREGREVGRFIGPAEWDAPEMTAVLKSVIAREASVSPAVQQKE